MSWFPQGVFHEPGRVSLAYLKRKTSGEDTGKTPALIHFLQRLSDVHNASGHQPCPRELSENLTFGQQLLGHHEESDHGYPEQVHNSCYEEQGHQNPAAAQTVCAVP